MSNRFSLPLAVLAIFEAGLLLAAFAVMHAWAYPAESLIAAPSGEGSAALGVAGIVVVCGLILLMMFSLGLYSWHLAHGYLDLLLRIVAAFVLAFVGYSAIVYVFDVIRVLPETLGLAMVAAVPAVFTGRVAFLRIANMAHLKRRVLVIGSGTNAARLQELENGGHASRFVVFAFIKLEPVDIEVDRQRVISLPNDLTNFCYEHGIEEIVMALEDRRGNLPLDALIRSRLNGMKLSDYQTFSERATGRVDIDALSPNWFLYSEGFRASRLHRTAKRGFDLAASLGLLAFALPLMLLTALAIRLESPGPVFYRQERGGQNGRPFVLIKFRSMRNDAEAAGAPQWAQVGDPRVTRVGSFIRKTRIDELPQLINVVKGEMSFVGPRPERPYFEEQLAAQIPFYRERNSVKPGITGWAQLNYPYGASVEDAKQKLQYDLFYIKHFTILFDLAIVLQTMRVILWSEGAR